MLSGLDEKAESMKKPKANRPNIVLIVTDQWRGDCLGLQGHPTLDTPNLDHVFRNGTMFSRAYSSVPSCIAARAALLTGLSQETHGRVGYQDRVQWNYPVTLPGELAKAGYQTHCVGKMHVFPARQLMGFHSVDLCDGYTHNERCRDEDYGLVDDYLPYLRRHAGAEADLTDAGVGCNGYSVSPWPYEERCHPTNWVTTKSVDFLRRRDSTKPFFLKVSYHRPHPPLDPPLPWLERYMGRTLPPRVVGDWAADRPLRAGHGEDSPAPTSEAQIELARRAYLAQLTHIDCQINRLIHALVERRLMQDTLLMFVSDHGDMLYDHNLLAKATGYDASARIPFLVRLPDAWKQPQTGETEAPVELRDVMPTLLEAAGAAIPAGVEGRSVLPLCRGEEPAWRADLHGEHSRGKMSNHWMTDGREMYIWYSQTGEEQLFDLRTDLRNERNVAPSCSERVAYWRARLVETLTGREEGYVADGKLVVGRTPLAVLADAGQG